MYSCFAVVNTLSNAAGQLVSERLSPEPHVWDDDNVQPMLTDPPPECFVPFDDETPKYLAYVPKFAINGVLWVVSDRLSDCDTSRH